MSAKIPGVVSGAVQPFAGIISASPGILGTSQNTQDVKDRFGSAADNAIEQAKGNVKTEGIDLGIKVLQKVTVPKLGNLGDLANQYLGRNGSKLSKTKADKYAPDPNGWYAQAKKRVDPLLSIDFSIDMPQVSNLKLPESYIEDIVLPIPNVEDYGVFLYGKRDYFAAIQDISSFNISCYEDHVLTVLSYYNTWRQRIRNPDGTFKAPSFYQRNITVYLTGPSGNENGFFDLFGQLTLVNCFPTNITGYDFGSQNAERIRPVIEFRCSDSIFVPFSENNGATVGNPRYGFQALTQDSSESGQVTENKKMSPGEFIKDSFTAIKSLGKNIVKDEISNIPNKIKF